MTFKGSFQPKPFYDKKERSWHEKKQKEYLTFLLPRNCCPQTLQLMTSLKPFYVLFELVDVPDPSLPTHMASPYFLQKDPSTF